MRLVPVIGVAVAVLLGLLFTEVAIRTVFDELQLLDPASGRYWKTAFQRRLGEAAQRHEQRDTTFDSTLGWRMRPGFHDGDVNHGTDGFRTTPSPAGATGSPILALGDSFTYGLGVADGDTYAARIAQRLKVPVVNAGVNAYGIDQALLIWELDGARIRPQWVILGYFVDDFFRNLLIVRDAPKPYFVPDGAADNFRLAGLPVPGPEAWPDHSRFRPEPRPRLLDAARFAAHRIGNRIGVPVGIDMESGAALSTYLLNRLNRSVEASGARLTVVTIAHCFDDDPRYRWVEAHIESACEDLALDCLNLAAAMRRPDRSSFYGHNCHFSPEGHAFAADALVARVPPLASGEIRP